MAGEAVPFIGVASCVRTFFAAAGAEEDEVEVNVELDDEEGKDDEEEEKMPIAPRCLFALLR